MECPNCEGQELVPTMTMRSIEVTLCEKCKGVWFDKGELEYFFDFYREFEDALMEAQPHAKDGKKISPASGKPMKEFAIFNGPLIDYCPDSGGHWLDGGELADLQDIANDGGKPKKKGLFSRFGRG